jgi:hypothetical protein
MDWLAAPCHFGEDTKFVITRKKLKSFYLPRRIEVVVSNNSGLTYKESTAA